MLKFIAFLLGPFLFTSAAAGPICGGELSREIFDEILSDTIDRFFPDLSGVEIVVSPLRSKEAYLQAQPAAVTLFRARRKRRYEIQLNARLLVCPPGREAIQSILAHELEHVRDYTGWSAQRLLRHGVRYASSLKFQRTYERATDEKVLQRGLGSGLAEYRIWVYQWLTPKALEKKRYLYFTPEEILGAVTER